LNNNFQNTVTKYLHKNLRNKRQLEWVETEVINTTVVVPAICEYDNIKNLLLSLSANTRSSFENTLIIFVVNHSISSNPEVKLDNKLTLEYLRSLLRKNPVDQSQKQILDSGIRIGLIDAASEGKEFEDIYAGVGLARKVGMDTSLQIFDYLMNNKKIIISLDADCLVQENYITEIQNYFRQNNNSVALVDFEHKLPKDESNKIGILSYEIFLRHYVTGLLFAGSPFAFHTVGSTIVCDHEAYIKVGGMNIKNAAEDFYFLQKLAKNFPVHRITSTRVKPSPRESWRVPFGTGRSITDFLSNKKNILVFDPDVFIILKEWLELFNTDLLLDPDSTLNEAKKIHIELYNFLVIRDFYKTWIKILNNTKSSKQLDYQRNNWFDSLETLKLMHHLRDRSFSMLEIKTGVDKLFKVVKHSAKFDSTTWISKQVQSLESYLSELKNLENLLSKKFNK
jgi:hypothetical protein